jgi:hypothetical protein
LKTAKAKPREMSPEVRAMIDVRHGAEQRGHFEPLGRLMVLETAHGLIEFPSERGEGIGPDLGTVVKSEAHEEGRAYMAVASGAWTDFQTLLVLGEWQGLPALRRSSPDPCPQCRHVCDVCDGRGKKQCNFLNCGGRGWYPGTWLPCPGPGCYKDTGHYKQDCATCATSTVRGQIAAQIPCDQCSGTGVMVCEGCKGSGKRSTGHVNGSLDWRMPVCKACGGSGRKGHFERQDVEKFTNAVLWSRLERRGVGQIKHLALGPIHSFTVNGFGANRLRCFEVSRDAAGDYLMLLVPASKRQKPQKAYLVGGVVRERASGQGAA